VTVDHDKKTYSEMTFKELEEMKGLKRRARKLIWLNPLLGTPEYRPICQGMRTALPFIDHFLPAHNFKGWKTLGDILLAESAKGGP
jgi:uncharacterized protein with von Willebrand factor type A (vWA) domain